MKAFDSERFARALCQKLNLELCDNFRAGSHDFPQGWKLLVERMLTAMRGSRVHIFMIREDHAMLDLRVAAEPESELTVYRAIHVYQQWASITCQVCGAAGKKRVMGGKVRVLCRGCMDKIEEQ